MLGSEAGGIDRRPSGNEPDGGGEGATDEREGGMLVRSPMGAPDGRTEGGAPLGRVVRGEASGARVGGGTNARRAIVQGS
jgi:hypothetical protein